MSNILNEISVNSDDEIYKYVITKYISKRYDKKGKYIPLSYILNKDPLYFKISTKHIKYGRLIHEHNGLSINDIIDSINNKYSLDNILIYLLNIFEFVYKLNSNNLIHLNISSDSIIISDKRAKLCNFEYSVDSNTLYTENILVLGIEWMCGYNFRDVMIKRDDYLLLPPELVIYKINNDRTFIKTKLKHYFSMISDIIKQNEHLYFIQKIKNKYTKHFNENFLFLKHIEYFNTDINKVDVYSLGIVLEELVFNYILSGKIPYNVQSILNDLFNLIIDMKKIHVDDRINIKNALNTYKLILSNMNNYNDINNLISDTVTKTLF